MKAFEIHSGAMALTKDLILPADVISELHDTIDRIPNGELVKLAELDPGFAQGFRAVPANAEKFRKRLHTLLDAPSVMPASVIESMRLNSFQQHFTCVLSSRALIEGYRSIANLVGEVRLLVSMLLDHRAAVVNKAMDILKSGAPLSPRLDSHEAARLAMESTFSPFLQELSCILLPPSSAPAAISQETEIAKLTEKIAAREAESRNASKKIASLDTKLEKRQEKILSLEEEIAQMTAKLDALKEQTLSSDRELAALRHDVKTKAKLIEKLEASIGQEKSEKSSAREQINELKARNHEFAEENSRLKRETADALQALAHIGETNKIQQMTEFIGTLEQTVPKDIPRRTLRMWIGDLTSSPVREDEKLVFLIDGHNVLNTSTTYVSIRERGASHEALRKILLRDIASIQSKLGNCEIRVHFDGPTPGEGVAFGNPNLKVIYSGGTGDHRADRTIVNYLSFYSLQANAAKIFTVSEDQDLRAEASINGSRLLYPREFLSLS